MKRLLLSLPLLLLWLPGCFQREGAAACHEFVDAWAARLVECGEYETHEQAETALVRSIEMSTPPRVMTCDDIWGLRDRVEFRDECLPAMAELPCGEAPPMSCDGQLLYE